MATNAVQPDTDAARSNWLGTTSAQPDGAWHTQVQAGSAVESGPLGMASIGQTALGLVVVIAIILLCMALLKRYGPYKRFAGHSLKLVAGQNVGPRERVVIVEVEDTWLVLGVAQNSVNMLHKLPARHDKQAAGATAANGSRTTLTQAFAANLQQARLRRSRR